MADFNSSLPVRTEAAGDVIAKIADATIPSQQLAVDASGKITAKLDDGAGNAVTSQVSGAQRALDVGIDVAGVQIDPRQIRALTAADVVTADIAAGTNLIGKVTINQGGNDAIVSAAGALKVDASATTQPVSGTVTANQGGAPWSQNITQIVGAAPSSTNYLPERLTDGTSYYDARQIRALTASDVVSAHISDATGTAFSPTNPLPVVFEVGGSGVCDYKDASSIASGASDNHDYTVTAGKTLYLNMVQASASGKAKMVLQVETGVASGVFTTKGAQFNSTATADMSFYIPSPIVVAAGVRVRVIMSNRDLLSEDLYSSIIGSEQ